MWFTGRHIRSTELSGFSSDDHNETIVGIGFFLMCCEAARGSVAKAKIFYLMMHALSKKLDFLHREFSCENAWKNVFRCSNEFPMAFKTAATKFPEKLATSA
ncbi:MAG: hypothetical protein ACYCOU_01480 [Sulfobacillus sp.]